MEKHYDIEYMCTYCGKKVRKIDSMGRPEPGICPRRNYPKISKMPLPHRWVINRKLEMK